MQIRNVPEPFESGIEGSAPQEWYGTKMPDGDRPPFSTAPVGSRYTYKPDTFQALTLTKRSNAGADTDWSPGVGVLAQRVSFSDFTDGGSTVGTLVLTGTIPKGAYAYRTVLTDLVGFTGDASATIQVGDGSDADRYSTGTPSVFTTAGALDVGAISGTSVHAAAISTVKITITSGTDWGKVEAGSFLIKIFYFA